MLQSALQFQTFLNSISSPEVALFLQQNKVPISFILVYGFERKNRLACDMAGVLNVCFCGFAGVWVGEWRGDLFHNPDISTPIPFARPKCVFF